MLARLFLIISVFCTVVLSQASGQSEAPLKLTISIKGQSCVGKKLVFVSQIQNTSSRDQLIDIRNVRLYRTDIAFDKSSSETIPTPKVRTSFGDGFLAGKNTLKKHLRLLKPGQSFEDEFEIDPVKDTFYDAVGKYVIQIGYGQYARLENTKGNLFVGSIDSNELVFQIRACQENLPMPFRSEQTELSKQSRQPSLQILRQQDLHRIIDCDDAGDVAIVIHDRESE